MWLTKDMLRWLDLQEGKDIIQVSDTMTKQFNLSKNQVNIAIGYWRFSWMTQPTPPS